MKKRFTAIIVILVFTLILSLCVGCQDKDNGKTKQTVRIAAPEGTPALAITRMIVDNKTIAGKNIEYGIVSPSNIAAEICDSVAKPIAVAVLKVLSFAVIFFVCDFFLQIAAKAVCKLFELPVIRSVNRTLGGVFGALKGVFVAVFACLLLVALGVADMGAAIFADVGVMVIAVLNAMRALSAAH